MSDSLTHLVAPSEAGQRLDQLLGLLRPDLGLRGRRRLCETGQALLNGQPANPAYKVRVGDLLCLTLPPEAALNPEVKLVKRSADLAAVSKPAGMPSARLAGGQADSLEDRLPALLGQADVQLLNRLDHGTSGLLAVALNAQGAQIWRDAQQQGTIRKLYLALLDGDLAEPATVRQALDMDKRLLGKVLAQINPDPARYSKFQPLLRFGLGDAARPVTLAVVEIGKGARHQIRAHAAWLGLPVLGDQAFGSDFADPYGFFLHHAQFELNQFSATIAPPWLTQLPPMAQQAGLDWLGALSR